MNDPRVHDLGLLCWSPLGMGILAGRYAEGQPYPEGSRAAERGEIHSERVTDRGIAVGSRFVELARDNDIAPLQLAVT